MEDNDIRRLVEALDEPSRSVIKYSFKINMSKQFTLAEIAKILDIPKERARHSYIMAMELLADATRLDTSQLRRRLEVIAIKSRAFKSPAAVETIGWAACWFDPHSGKNIGVISNTTSGHKPTTTNRMFEFVESLAREMGGYYEGFLKCNNRRSKQYWVRNHMTIRIQKVKIVPIGPEPEK